MKRFCCWTLKNFGEFINNTDWNKARTTSNFEIEQRYEQHYEHLFNPNSWKHVEPLWCIWTSFWRCWWEIPYYSKKFIRITRQLSPAWKNAVIFRFVNDLFINVAIQDTCIASMNVVLIFVSSFLDSYLRFFKTLALTMWFLGHQMELLLLFRDKKGLEEQVVPLYFQNRVYFRSFLRKVSIYKYLSEL